MKTPIIYLSSAAKKEYVAKIRELANFVRNRDKRVIAQKKKMLEEAERKRKEDEVKKADMAEAKKKAREEAKLEERERWRKYASTPSCGIEKHQVSPRRGRLTPPNFMT